MRLFLLIISICLSSLLDAQSVYGTLTDSTTGSPIPFANVLIKGTLIGKQTAENGSFVIQPQDFPVTLVFTCMGYRTCEVIVSQANKALSISLSPSAQMLNEIVISSSPLECIQKDLSLMATDFEFCDNYLLVLAYQDFNSPARLMLLDEFGSNVHTMYVSAKMESLYRDCFGRVHASSKDSSWQVYFDYEKLQLISPVAKETMETTFQGIDLFFAGTLFTRMYTYHNQHCDFLAAWKGNNMIIHSSSDKEGVTRVQTNYDLSYFLRMRRRGQGYLYSTDYLQNNLLTLQAQVRLSSADAASMSPVKAQVVQHNLSVWIFDFTNNMATRFNERMLKTDSVAISFHHNPGWTGELLRDESTDDLYTTIERNGQLKICRLHDRTFDIEQEWIIENKPFPVNVRIRNSVVYFLWIDRTEVGSNRMLYRFRL